jgi:hypothetical protein
MSEELEFSEESLVRSAIEATGLRDFGGETFREGLRKLIETYESHDFDERGRKRNHRRLLGLLVTRLQLEDWWKRHPEILERPLVAPWVLTGLPRSGTSAIFNLLAEDPATRTLRLWETQFPYPPEGWTESQRGRPDSRREAVEAHYARGRAKNPDFTQIHFASADTPEECVLIQALSFAGVQHGVEAMMEPYASWFRAQDQSAVYEIERKILQLLDWQRPGKRWLLKTPAHMWGINELLQSFPDARIIWSHRSPTEAIASMSSMIATLMKTRRDLDPRKLGPIVLDFYATSLERGLAARDRLDPSRFVDVSHDAFVQNGLRTAERIYRHFSIPFDRELTQMMGTHLQKHPRDSHGQHDYALSEFGLTSNDVRELFSAYVDRFDLTWE